jgi:catechol 2,3-dioxygenase-like lactoylglutathione lyase family enzyme
MGVERCKVEAMVPVSDMARAKQFYEGKLGLSGGEEAGDGGTTYQCGGGSAIHVYPSPDNAGKSGATVAAWGADDFDELADELAGNGVEFERYDSGPFQTNEKGIAEIEGVKVAWFKDPDGNTLAIGPP